jgi:hypothetical protein
LKSSSHFSVVMPVFTTILTVLGCSSPKVNSSQTNSTDNSKAQLKSIAYVYYKGAGMPEMPDADEISLSLERLSDDSVHKSERKILKKLFGKSPRNLALALRDSDGDGVLDYRISDINGKFEEGDLDVDGDGIRNIYDISPYDVELGGVDNNSDGIPDSDFEDINSNSLPDHLDWALTKIKLKSSSPKAYGSMVRQQKELFDRHQVILVERDRKFTAKVVNSVHITITKVFSRTFGTSSATYRSLPTLRTVAAEKFAWLLDDDGEACATFFSPNQTLIITKSGMASSTLFQISLYAHEIAHALHFDKDYDSSDLNSENSKVFYPMENFLEEISPYKWSSKTQNVSTIFDYTLMSPLNEITPKFYFRSKTTQYWSDWLNKIYYEVGDLYLEEKKVASKFIVSDYALTNPMEWYGDNVIASFLVQMEDAAINLIEDEDEDEKLDFKIRLKKAIADNWPGFYHANIRGADFEEYFANEIQIPEDVLAELAQSLMLDTKL